MGESLHEFNCCLCGRHFTGIYGNNPWPVYEKKECCNECNKIIVLEARSLRLESRMEQIPHFTVAGNDELYQSGVFKKGMKLSLIKESGSGQDGYIIRVENKKLGTIGYVADTSDTVIGQTKWAHEIYDQVDNKTVGRVILSTPKGIICAIEPDSRMLKSLNKKR